MPIRFHLDENVSGKIAYGLRIRGIDITMPGDVGLISATDEEHLAFAREERRVIFTHDDDFLVLHASGIQHAGIAYCALRTRTVGETVLHLTLMSKIMNEDEMRNHVEYI